MTEAKRKVGRPTKVEVAARKARENYPDRLPISGDRDILTVFGLDPAYEYRWVLDKQENGNRIFRFRRAGYEFCTSDQNLNVGEMMVYTSENVGSIYRVPAGDRQPGEYLYLMRIPKELYDEDFATKQSEITAIEKGQARPDEQLGQYGSVSIQNNMKQ